MEERGKAMLGELKKNLGWWVTLYSLYKGDYANLYMPLKFTYTPTERLDFVAQ